MAQTFVATIAYETLLILRVFGSNETDGKPITFNKLLIHLS